MPFVALPTPGGARKKPSAPVQPLLLRKFVLADPVSAALLAYLMTFERSASAVHETPHHIFDKLGKPFCIVGHTDRLVAWLALAKDNSPTIWLSLTYENSLYAFPWPAASPPPLRQNLQLCQCGLPFAKAPWEPSLRPSLEPVVVVCDWPSSFSK
eukprot:TRINITY_DN1386_c0_g1_i2.p2 TRINITY_DN1386_c0_g1~~TRINITY_DN1386_c0_g1_i2.p2  ORF type:complete len:155 (+),score=17.35 TRINITY_DN1386_c0_g1_i2:718-1182(+)